MRLSELPAWPAVLSLSLFSSAALAQEFELDLSEPQVALEFRPTIAVIGVSSGEATEDPVITARAALLEAELVKAAINSSAFGKVTDPSLAATELGEKAAAARKCGDFACLDAVAKALKVDRVITGLITRSGPASLLTVKGLDPALPEVLEGLVESGERAEKAKAGGFAGIQGKSQALKDKEFVKSAIPVFLEQLDKLKTPNGKISIDSAEPSSVALLNGAELGVGSFEKVLPRGSYEITVTAAGYLPFETTAVVEPQKVVAVKVLLKAKPLEKKVVVVEVQRGTPVVQRPGLYIAAAGVVAAAVGVVLGINAKNVERRAVPDGDGVVPITRAAAKGAKTNAMLANTLVGVGAAAAVGGAVWVVLTPGIAPAKKEDAPTDVGGGFGVMVGYGGSF